MEESSGKNFGVLLLKEETHLVDQFDPKLEVAIISPLFSFWILSEDPNLTPVILDLDYREPVKPNQKVITFAEDLYTSIDQDQKVMEAKSKLNYFLSENLLPDDFYWALVDQKNSTDTYYHKYLKLVYREFDVWATPKILEEISRYLKLEVGYLLVSTHTLSQLLVPKWVTWGLLADILSENQIDLSDKIILNGANTDSIYLFLQPNLIPTEEYVQDFIDTLLGLLKDQIQLKIFPSSTPHHLVLAKGLKKLTNGQWILETELLPMLSPYDSTNHLRFNLPNLTALLTFLKSLQKLGTWLFIEKELKIEIHPNDILVFYETAYLPDYMKVYEAYLLAKDIANADTKIFYIKKDWALKFWDALWEKEAYLSDPDYQTKNFQQVTDWSLENRISLSLFKERGDQIY